MHLVRQTAGRDDYHAEILTASLLTVGLGLALDLLLALTTRALMPWSRSRS
jgi:ABC-type nitrate/sulfonate/bicarbonate transport system permease component